MPQILIKSLILFKKGGRSEWNNDNGRRKKAQVERNIGYTACGKLLLLVILYVI